MHSKLSLIAGLAALAISTGASAQPGCAPGPSGGGAASIPCSGYYDADGVRRLGGGHYDADGDWHSDSGYYDVDGAWVTLTPATTTSGPPVATTFGVDAAFVGGPVAIDKRARWLDGLIRKGRAGGALTRIDAASDLTRLAAIRGLEARYAARHDGLTGKDRDRLGARLDDLGAAVTAQWRPAR